MNGRHYGGPIAVHTPDLIVEVLSPSTAARDLRQKKALYERAGVRDRVPYGARFRSLIAVWPVLIGFINMWQSFGLGYNFNL